MTDGQLPKRSSFVGTVPSYAEIGASQDPDLLKFPPNGATAFFDAAKLGSGALRLAAAVEKLMTGQVFGAAGFTAQLHPQHFSQQDAQQLKNAQQVNSAHELVYAQDGTPFLSTGAHISVTINKVERLLMVVRAFHTAQAACLVFGSVDTSAFNGEFSLSVQTRQDGNVWGFVRGFWHDNVKRFLGLGASGSQQGIEFATQLLCVLAPQPLVLSRKQLNKQLLQAAQVSPEHTLPPCFDTAGDFQPVGLAVAASESGVAADYEEAEVR